MSRKKGRKSADRSTTELEQCLYEATVECNHQDSRHDRKVEIPIQASRLPQDFPVSVVKGRES